MPKKAKVPQLGKLSLTLLASLFVLLGCGGESAEPDTEQSVGEVSLKESFEIGYIGATAEPFAAILLRLSELELRQPGRVEELVPGPELDPDTVIDEFDLIIDSIGYFESQVEPEINRLARPTILEIDESLGSGVSVTESGFNTAVDLYVFGLPGEGIEPIEWEQFTTPANLALLNPVEATQELGEDGTVLDEAVPPVPAVGSELNPVKYYSVGQVSASLESALVASGVNFEPEELESTNELSAELLDLSEAGTPFVSHLGFPSPITASIPMRRITLPCGDLCPPLQSSVLKLQSENVEPAVEGLFGSASLTQEQYANLLDSFSSDQDQQSSVDAWIADNTDIWSSWL